MINRTLNTYIHDIIPFKMDGDTIIQRLDVSIYETPFKTEPTLGEFCPLENLEFIEVIEALEKRFLLLFEGSGEKKGFPNCCDPHANLLEIKDFDRSSFITAPKMTALKIVFTHQHIRNNQDSLTFTKDISDYIVYTVESFGQMPHRCGEPLFLSEYFHYIKVLIQEDSGILEDNKEKLLTLINNIKNPSQSKNSKTDLNILIDTYQKWLKIFPFEISFFNPMESHFRKTLPFWNGETTVNQFTGAVKAKTHTKSSLIEGLQILTKNLLASVNVPDLRKEGALTDIQANKLEFAEASLNTKTSEITGQFHKGELKYVKALKSWLKIHKNYFEEITPLLQALPPVTVPTEKKLSIKEIALLLNYRKVIADRSKCNELIKEYGHTSGDKLYNEFVHFSSLQNRKGYPGTIKKWENQIKRIQNILGHLCGESKQQALNELETLKSINKQE